MGGACVNGSKLHVQSAGEQEVPGLGGVTRQAEHQPLATSLSENMAIFVLLLLIVSIIITSENDHLEEWEQKSQSM